MVSVARAKFRELRKVTSKKGNTFNIVEFGADDYRAVSMFIPDDKVHIVENLKDGESVTIQFTLESRMSGLSASLIDCERK